MSAARSRSSRVDATLFATKRPKSNPTFSSSLSSSSSKNGGASQAVVSSTLLKKLTGKQANAKESTVITKNDLEAIQHAVGYSNNSSANPAEVATTAAFSTTSSIAALRGSGAPSSAKSATISARAKARKEKMVAIDRERKDLGGDMLDTFQQEEEKQRSEVLHRARGALDEELDDVKHMNQMILYAKCVTIRDAQIVEKRKREEEAIDEEKRLDIAMEIERIKTLKMLEEREEARKLEQRLGAQVIIKQIEEREAERIRQQEMREQEAQAMVQRVRELELREEEERKEKVLAGRKLLQGVMEANNAQARAKLRKKQEEIEEEQRIAEYIRAKEARERDEEERKEKDRSDKEREIARLRAMQEKAQDRQAAMDELRAKRYQEAKDRKWREQQLESAQKKEGMKREIALAREMQRQEKARRIAEQALQERDEYMRVLEWQKQQTEIDKKKEDSQKAAALRHREELLSQIREHEKSRDDARKMYLSEGKVIASQMEADKQKLLRIKESKLGELEKAGVPEKYRTELAKYKVLVASIH